MRWPLVLLISCALTQVARADTRGTPLGLLMDQAEVVVLGEFTSQPVGESGEAGVVHYQGQFKIERLIKPDERASLTSAAPGTTHTVEVAISAGS